MKLFEEQKVDSKQLININKATQEELQKLTGIGESTAKKIINYREEYGKFKKIEGNKPIINAKYIIKNTD